MINRGELEREIQVLEGEANELRRMNRETDYLMKMAEVNAKKAELEKIDIADIAEEVKTSEFPFILTVGGQEVNFREWIPQEVNYQVIAIAVSQKLYELEAIRNAQLAERDQLIEQERVQHANQLLAVDESNDAKYNELYEQFQALKLETQSLKAERDVLKEEIQAGHQTKLERDELERKLQAAGNEIESLKNQLASAQVKETPKITNMDSGALAEAIRKANEAKPRIYNKRAGDQKTSFYLANLVTTSEEIIIPWTQIGQYVEVSDEEAARFQSELEAAATVVEETEPVETTGMVGGVTITAPQFPEVSHDDTGSEVAGDPVEAEGLQNHDVGTVEERLAALELAVFGQAKAAA